MHPQSLRAQYETRIRERLADLDRHYLGLYRHRRARFPRGTYVERCLFSVLWDRDKGVCQICFRPIDLLCPPQDPWAPTGDHIIPISLCGHHTYDNLQLAHKICNSRKHGLVLRGRDPTVEPDDQEDGGDRPWDDWVRGGTPAWND